MQISRLHLHNQTVKEDKYKFSTIRRLKYVKQVCFERLISKIYFNDLKQNLLKVLTKTKILRKLKLTPNIKGFDRMMIVPLLHELHLPIINRFNQCLKGIRGVSTFPRIKQLRGLSQTLVFWENKKFFEVPVYQKRLDYLEIIFKLKEPTLGNNQNPRIISLDYHHMIRLRRMANVKEVKIGGTICQLWRMFTFLKEKMPSIAMKFHLFFNCLDCNPQNIAEMANKMPFFNQKTYEFFNMQPISIMNHFVENREFMKSLATFAYFNIREPDPTTLKIPTLRLFESYDNLRNIALSMHEREGTKILEDFFNYITFPRHLESYKLTLFLKKFNIENRSALSHYYREFSKLSKLKELSFCADFTPNQPNYEITSKLYSHFIEVLTKLNSLNPLEALHFDLQPIAPNNIVYTIRFDNFLQYLTKFRNLREVKINVYLAQFNCFMGQSSLDELKAKQPEPFLPKLTTFIMHGAEIEGKVLKLLRNEAPALNYLSLDLYSTVLPFKTVLDICKGIQILKSLNMCHFQTHAPLVKKEANSKCIEKTMDIETQASLEKLLVEEIKEMYSLPCLKKACFMFPFEKISREYVDEISQRFIYKGMECTKVETKEWTVLSNALCNWYRMVND